MPQTDTTETPILRLLSIMERLRNKDTGCPWDIEQTPASIAPCAIEEAYELAAAIDKNDTENYREELGDLLLQVVFHSQMAKEGGLFTFDDVARTLCEKLVSRHPHVFGDQDAANSAQVIDIWESQKKKEKEARGSSSVATSILDDVPLALPALMRTQKLSKRAAKAGFEWQKTEDVIDKIAEELAELRAEIIDKNKKNQTEEIGDLLFTVVQLGRWLDIDCEEALRQCNGKFHRRFSGMEAEARSKDKDLKSLSPDQWEEYWQRQKEKEKPQADAL